ncbi:MAG: ABC transporter permease [Anaerolineales bacterium]|nr:ABC transporter permease [Anaerolineales bacterium]
MNILTITFKDLADSLRKPLVLAFMLVLPLLQAGLPYLAFNGLAGGLDVQITRVLVVDLDQPNPAYPEFRAGELLTAMLADEQLANLLEVTLSDDAYAARRMVEAGQADVAVIIPPELTASLFEPEGRAAVSIYHDPTLTLGPGIVRDVVVNFLDGFAGALIAADLTTLQLEALGQQVTDRTRQEAMQRYGTWAQSVGESLSRGVHPAIDYGDPVEVHQTGSLMKAIVGPMMAGMLVFFAFFVGAFAAQSLLREDEQGTLKRLFRTPLSRGRILTGKFLAVVILLLLQTVLLLGFGSLLFGIHWGAALPVAVNGLGLALSAAGFGIMLISFMRTSRQAFLVMGGAVILTGMAGGTMTTTFASLPAAFRLLNLFTPQGWVLRGFEAALQGRALLEAAVPALVAAATGLAFLLVGWHNLNRRYS